MLNAAAVVAEKSVGKGEFFDILMNSLNEEIGVNSDSRTCGEIGV